MSYLGVLRGTAFIQYHFLEFPTIPCSLLSTPCHPIPSLFQPVYFRVQSYLELFIFGSATDSLSD